MRVALFSGRANGGKKPASMRRVAAVAHQRTGLRQDGCPAARRITHYVALTVL
jgi:hypothetical protein